MRKDGAEFLTRLAVLLKLMLWTEAIELCPLKLCDGLPLGKRLRHRLAVHLGQFRLVIKRLEMRHAAGHVQPDDATYFGRYLPSATCGFAFACHQPGI